VSQLVGWMAFMRTMWGASCRARLPPSFLMNNGGRLFCRILRRPRDRHYGSTAGLMKVRRRSGADGRRRLRLGQAGRSRTMWIVLASLRPQVRMNAIIHQLRHRYLLTRPIPYFCPPWKNPTKEDAPRRSG